MADINLDKKLVGNIEGEFLVPAYQRGYRWKDEVKTLLEDIGGLAEGQNYCLQPVVVKNIGEKKYELIDGQQRLTTIFLILRYIKLLNVPFKLNFSIEYKTREASKEFLENINPEKLEIKPENMDEYFIIEAYKTIFS
jgi:uncharacterized protein with ParB-like and HNH nuclease domain